MKRVTDEFNNKDYEMQLSRVNHLVREKYKYL